LRQRYFVSILVLCMSLAAVSLFAQTATTKGGSLSGVVTGDDKQPLSALVIATKPGPPLVRTTVQSGADGAFSFPGLAAGEYQICASIANNAYLNPCTWAPISPTAEVTAGQSTTGFKLIMRKGATLTVKINDPELALTSAAVAGKVGPHVILGVFTPRGMYLPLAISSKDALGTSHSVSIPMDQDVPLHLVGKDLDVTDSSGTKVNLNGATVAVKLPSATPQKFVQAPVVFTVTPKKP
jgi:hypothetical protein